MKQAETDTATPDNVPFPRLSESQCERIHGASLDILDRVGVRPSERVLELGPGPGMFTVDAAQRVGPEGRLIAVDIQPKMIAQVEKRVRDTGLTNVETHVADAYHLPLDDTSVDRAFLVTVLPEVPDQSRALAELRRVIKPGGLLSITEEFFDPDYPFAFETVHRKHLGWVRRCDNRQPYQDSQDG